MSRSRSDAASDRPAGPQAALDALLGEEAGDPGRTLLLRRALWLETLDRQLRPCLPPALAAHARLANVDRGRLVYLVDTPVWHAKLRLAATGLLDTARSLGLEVEALVVRTAREPLKPRPDTADTPNPTPLPLPAAARDAFAAALASRDDPNREDPS
jgi:hypothetical protein